MLKVEGEENKRGYSGTIRDGIYFPEGGTPQTIPKVAGTPNNTVAKPLAQQVVSGKALYGRTCSACHQAEGQGVPNAFPPLAKSDFLNANPDRAVNAVLHGLSGEVTVNGKKFNNVMTSQNLTDDEVSDVLTYVYNSWGNNKTIITPEKVKAIRAKPAPKAKDVHE